MYDFPTLSELHFHGSWNKIKELYPLRTSRFLDPDSCLIGNYTISQCVLILAIISMTLLEYLVDFRWFSSNVVDAKRVPDPEGCNVYIGNIRLLLAWHPEAGWLRRIYDISRGLHVRWHPGEAPAASQIDNEACSWYASVTREPAECQSEDSHGGDTIL